MTITVTHSTPADDTFSTTGAAAWDAGHVLTGTVPVANGGTGAATLTGYVKGSGTSNMTASSTIPSTDVTGLGTMATQDANNVTITGGSISGVSVSGVVTSVSGTAPIASSGGATPAISISQATTSTNGYLSSTDWNTFNNKGSGTVTSVSGTAPIASTGGATPAISISQATTSTNGYLSSTDWNTFNGKAPATSGTSLLYGNGAGGFSNATIGSGITFTGGTLSATGSGGDVVGPASATDNAIVRFDATTGKLIQNSTVTIDDAGNIISPDSVQFSGTVPATQPIGTLWFDSTTDSLNLQQNAITQQIGEEIYVYGKASNTISGQTLLQAIVKTGTVGASGVIQFGVAGAGVTDAGVFIGVATEDIATNSFGRVTNFGIVHGINTSGSTYGETWVDGQDIWYNPTTGGLTKTKPSAPNIKVQLGTVINAGSGGSGSFQVLIGTGSSLGGTDDNVQLSSPTAAQLLTYSTTDSYWKNTSLAAGTGISVGNAASGVITVTNAAPDQTVSIASGTGISATGTYPAFTVTNTAPDQTVAISSGTGISVTGTYPNFTVTNTAPSSGGTVTSVTGTAPVVSSGGNTPAISMAAATGSVDGYLTSTDWTTFNNKQPAGSYLTAVTADAPLSGSGTSGSHLVISQATTSTSGYLSSTDWNTFNNKGSGTVTSVSGTSGRVTSTGGATPVIDLAASGVSANTYGSSTAIPVITFDTYGRATTVTTAAVAGGQYYGTAATKAIAYNSNSIAENITILANTNGLSAGPITISTGYTVTVATDAVWVIV